MMSKEQSKQRRTGNEQAEKTLDGRSGGKAGVRGSVEKHLEMLADVAPVGIFQTDPAGNCVYVNHGWCAQTGLSHDQALGQGWAAAIHPEDRDRVFKDWVSTAGQGKEFLSEYRWRKPSGEVVFVSSRSTPLHDEVGKLIGHLGANTDITERKVAEEDLAERERQFDALITNLPGMVYRCVNDSDWTMNFVSEGCLSLTGYSSVDFTDKKISLAGLIHPDDRQRVWDLVQSSLDEDDPFQLVFRIRTRDGDERWVWEQGIGVYTEDGELRFLEGVMLDITEQQRLASLRAGEARVLELIATAKPLPEILSLLTDVVEKQYDGLLCSILLLDKNGKHLTHGAAGSLPDEYVRALDGVAIGPEVGSCGTAAHRRELVITEDISTDPLWRNYRELASRHDLRACWSQPILSSEGGVFGAFAMYYRKPSRPTVGELGVLATAGRLAGVAIERSRRAEALEQANRELERREDELRIIFENAPLGMTIVEPLKAKRHLWNQAFCRMVGYSEQELRSFTFRDLIHPQEPDSVVNAIDELVQRGWGSISLNTKLVRKGGDTVDVAVHAALLPGPKDAPALAVTQVEDLTERLRAEREAREHQDRLAHVARVSTMGEMATNIAHEVNQPLTAIATYADACRRMVEAGMTGDADVVDILDEISKEAVRAGNIIHRLRGLVRRQKGQRAECDLNALIRDVGQLAGVDARLRGVHLDFDLADGAPAVIADSVQLQQVILNLIRNGIDAVEERTDGDKRVTASTATLDGRGVEVTVSDNGCGLGDVSEEQLFQPFFTTKETGMGMGLSISRSIVTSHGGRMWFTANSDGGTAFHFSVPAAVGDDEDAI